MLRLENLDTDLRPPAAALEATRRAVDEDDANSYLPFLGADVLRRTAAAHVGALAGLEYDWRRSCLITAGGLSGILTTLLALLEPGDAVVTTDPIYVGLLNRIRIAGGAPLLVPYRPELGGWRLDVDALRAARERRPRVVLMMSPSMPSGAVLTRAEWQAVADLCRATDAWLLYDAAMERILYDGAPYLHPASLPGMAERTITVGAVSKEQRMIGWRVGWVVGPPDIVDDIGLVSISNVVCRVGIAQAAAAAALAAACGRPRGRGRRVAAPPRRHSSRMRGGLADRAWRMAAGRCCSTWRLWAGTAPRRHGGSWSGSHRGHGHGELGQRAERSLRALRLLQ